MSMFHELMMRKKEETLYPVIKGSLTESPSGVFSGFSNANYLKLSPIDTSSFQFVFKITTSATFGQFEGIIVEDTATTYKSRVQISPYGKIMLLLSSNGTSWDIADNVSSSQILSNNTDYYIKFVFDGTKYVVSFSADGQTYETAITVNSTTTLRQLPYIIGYNTANATAFSGSIDLNNSYIKIGSTKYNLQAVVGYTVVGSPTITDGVVSGFSHSNYLSLPAITLGKKDFEFVVKLKPSTISTQRILTDDNAGSYFTGVIIRNSTGEIQACAWNGTTHLFVNSGENNVIQANSTCYVKFYRAGTKLGVGISANGVTYTTNAIDINESDNFIFYANKTLLIGATTAYETPFGGSIDLNETYIKIEGKLIFNGQQA